MRIHPDYIQRNPNALVPLEHDPYVVTLPNRLFVVWVAVVNGRLRWKLASQMADGPRRFNGPTFGGECTARAIEAMVVGWWEARKALGLTADR